MKNPIQKPLQIFFLTIVIYIIFPQKVLLAEERTEIILVNTKLRDIQLKQQLDSLKIVIKPEMKHISTYNENINDIFRKDNDSSGVENPFDYIPARPIKTAQPIYPISDPLSGKIKEAKVYIKMWVDIDGKVKNVKIIKSSGYPELDTAAVDAAYQWLYTPAQFKGKPIRVWVAGRIDFVLE